MITFLIVTILTRCVLRRFFWRFAVNWRRPWVHLLRFALLCIVLQRIGNDLKRICCVLRCFARDSVWDRLTRTSTSNFKTELLISTPTGLFLAYSHATLISHFHYRFHDNFSDRYYPNSQNPSCNLNFCGVLWWFGDDLECICCVLSRFFAVNLATTSSAFASFCVVWRRFAVFCGISQRFAAFCCVLRRFKVFWGIFRRHCRLRYG